MKKPIVIAFGIAGLAFAEPWAAADLLSSNTMNTFSTSSNLAGTAGPCVCSDGRPGNAAGQSGSSISGGIELSPDFETSSDPSSIGGVVGGDAGIGSSSSSTTGSNVFGGSGSCSCAGSSAEQMAGSVGDPNAENLTAPGSGELNSSFNPSFDPSFDQSLDSTTGVPNPETGSGFGGATSGDSAGSVSPGTFDSRTENGSDFTGGSNTSGAASGGFPSGSTSGGATTSGFGAGQ